jgi:protein-S-isoprenylcysteine O-methyltransferase Ste14
MHISIFAASLVAYYSLHSLLAAESVKKRLLRLILPRFYRLFYNFLALTLLLPPVYLYLELDRHSLIEASLGWTLAGGALVLWGMYWLWKAMGGYDLSEFTGLYQLKQGHPPVSMKLNISGLNNYVRHPLYFGTLLVIWGLFLAVPTDAMLVIGVVSTVYIYIGTVLEERKLTQQFGEDYRLYQRNVPMLLPFFRRKSNQAN